jgi:antitoxin ParD1/3/4
MILKEFFGLGRSLTIEAIHTLVLPLCNSLCRLKIEQLVQQQIDSGKYASIVEVIVAGVKLLEQQDVYQGRLQELQQDALVGWEASQRGEVVDGMTAIEQIRTGLRSRGNANVRFV